MHQNLSERVIDIWTETVMPHEPTLQMVADTVSVWERLFAEYYDKLDDENSREFSDALGTASRTLIRNGYLAAAIQILVDAWKRTGKRQTETDRKIYRAGIAFFLSEIYFRQGDKGAACWWQLHALADAYLEGEETGGGAKIFLEMILGVPKQAFVSCFKTIATDNRNSCKRSDWTIQEGFAEDVVIKFAIIYPEWASVFSYATNEPEFPLSPGYLSVLYQNIKTDPQGTNLEYLACYLFLHLPGCTPVHNLLDEDNTMQTDVVVRNFTPHGNLLGETFGRYFAIECKNWANPIGSSECGYFLQRLNLLHFHFGVILAKNGITGSPKSDQADETAARQLIRRSFHENGTMCIVLNDKDHLVKLKDDSTTFRALLFKEIERFRFGKSNSAGSENAILKTGN